MNLLHKIKNKCKNATYFLPNLPEVNILTTLFPGSQSVKPPACCIKALFPRAKDLHPVSPV